MSYEYDVALSFVGEQRNYIKKVAKDSVEEYFLIVRLKSIQFFGLQVIIKKIKLLINLLKIMNNSKIIK